MPRRKAKVPAPPATLNPSAATRWKAVVPDLMARGSFDAVLVERYCQVWARWQEAEQAVTKTGTLVRTQQGRAVQNPYLAVASKAARDVVALEMRLGLAQAAEDGPPAPGAGRYLTRRQLAIALGKHMQTITKWEREGMPVARRGRRGRPSQYLEADCRAWLEARESAAGTGAVDVARARAERDTWQAKLAEQQYQIKSRLLLPREEVEKAWASEVAAVRTIIIDSYVSWTDRVTRAATLEGRAGVERELRALADSALLELSDPDRPIGSLT